MRWLLVLCLGRLPRERLVVVSEPKLLLVHDDAMLAVLAVEAAMLILEPFRGPCLGNPKM